MNTHYTFTFKKLNFKLKLFIAFAIYITLFFTNISFINTSKNNFLFATSTTTNEDNISLYSNNLLLMDAENENVLFEKSGYTKVYPASTTKILTAILAIENLNLDDKIVVSKNAVYSTPEGSSVIYLKEGEIISTENVLYGLLLKSGNDAANVLAENISGNIDNFVILMNEKLKEIGCNDTHFTNAHGFHDPNHYSTAYDMAKLIHYAMQNETFRKIVETKYFEIPATNKTETRKYYNTSKMFFESYPAMYYQYFLGGKTGYTEEARGTFVGYAKKDDKFVIVAVFDGSQNVSRNEARFLDAKTIFEYCFNNFEREKIVNKDDYIFKIKDENTKKEYTVKLSDDIYALVNDSKYMDNNNITYELSIDFNKLSSDNINSDETIGKINIEIKGEDLNISDDYNLIFVNSIDYFPLNYYINKYILYVPLVLLILLVFILILMLLKKDAKNNYKSKNSKRKRKAEIKF